MFIDTSNTRTSAFASLVSADDFGDAELVESVEKLRRTNKIMEMENYIMENHLRKNEPKSLANMDHILEQASRIQNRILQKGLQSQGSITRSTTPSRGSISGLRSKTSTISHLSALAQGKRINLNTKIELVKKERDLCMEDVEQYYNRAKLLKLNLTADLEQMVLQKAETEEAMEIFEERIVKYSSDVLAQKIPVEKFIRHIEDWLRCADAIIARLRLRCSAYQYKNIFLRGQLKQKEELGDTLLPVDLEQMKIEFHVLSQKLEERNDDLLDLKKKAGDAGFALTQHKKYLQQQMQDLDSMRVRIVKQKKKITALTKSRDFVRREVKVSQQKLKTTIYLVENFTAPDLLEYIMKRKELRDLQKSITVWTRRTGIQENTLKAFIQQMKRMTGTKKTNKLWFVLPVTEESKESNSDEDLEPLDEANVIN